MPNKYPMAYEEYEKRVIELFLKLYPQDKQDIGMRSLNEEKRKKFLVDAYNEKRELLHYRFNIVNIKRVRQREEELFGLGEYLPNLLRDFLSLDYYTCMEEMGVIDDVLTEIGKTRKQGRQADTIEFVEWIDDHEEFSDLLNENELEKLDYELKEVEKWRDDVLEIIRSKN